LGNFRIFRRTVEGTDLAVATYGGWSDYAKDQLAKYSFTSYEQVVNLFGTNPRKRYLVVYCPPASDGRDISGWAESSQSQGIAVWGGWGWQEGVGWKRPFLHRVIHIWNVFPPFGMQAATRTADWTWWFAEGSADYYAWDRILIKLGVLSSHRILREFFQTYTSQYVGTRYDVPVAEAYQFTRELNAISS
jgi:predicted metalloprotease with PDZ domain